MNLENKKIGIWGFGVVGKSAAKYLASKINSKNNLYTKNNAQIKTNSLAQNNSQIIVLEKRELNPQELEFISQFGISLFDQKDSKKLEQFLEECDFIIPSPGIDLREHKKYSNKFISELDIFSSDFCGPIIGITGTVGKTTITHMLDQIIRAQGVNIWTGGNIGIPVLDAILTCTKSQEPNQNEPNKQKSDLKNLNQQKLKNKEDIFQEPEIKNDIDMALLELSSFQLELCKSFAPDLAIWTNFFPNHLDKHSNIEEYFDAKLQIIANQNAYQNNKENISENFVKNQNIYPTESKQKLQQALLPLNLIDMLLPKIKKYGIKSGLNFFSSSRPDPQAISKLGSGDTIFFFDSPDDWQVYKITVNTQPTDQTYNDSACFTPEPTCPTYSNCSAPEAIGSTEPIAALAEFTFRENLLVILSTLYIFAEIVNRNYALSDARVIKNANLVNKLGNLKAFNFSNIDPLSCQIEHRLEKVATINGVHYYNDSKATTTTSTLAAVQKLITKNSPIILLLGGLSKGVDRSGMIKELASKIEQTNFKKQGYIKLVICFGKEAGALESMCNAENIPCMTFKTLDEALQAANNAAKPGDQVALSPSGSSFDLFKDYQERGRYFKELVKNLAKN